MSTKCGRNSFPPDEKNGIFRYTRRMFFHSKPLVSVCIPVYNSEPYLMRCLESVAAQDFPGAKTEIIVVNDASCGTDADGNDCAAIVKSFKKQHKKNIKLFCHTRNKGLVEARRTAICEAEGEYICILDSDDWLEPGALRLLYEAAQNTGADIVQGKANAILPPDFSSLSTGEQASVKKTAEKKQETANIASKEPLLGKDILKGYTVLRNHNGFLWGKLILRDTYLNALEHIPPIFCTMLEDTIQYFFIAFEAKKYISIDATVYNYSINTGISTGTRITTLSQWEHICSAASVFTALFDEISRLPKDSFLPEEMYAVKKECRGMLRKNIQQMDFVTPELKKEARDILCEYWGHSFVQEIECEIKADGNSTASS